jgi:hypothetical protein
VLVYRYAPVRSRGPRTWSVCPATSDGLPGAGSASGFTTASSHRISPRSFIYHFAVKALLPLI